jgi:YHS domain-containing protein
VKKLNSFTWIYAVAFLLVAVAACSTGEQEKAEPAGGRGQPTDAPAAVTEQPMQTTDPVCGMSVSTASKHMATHGGETYYFCSAGCAESFGEHPEAYVKEEKPGMPSEG